MKLVEIATPDVEKQRLDALKRTSVNAKQQLKQEQARQKLVKARRDLNDLAVPANPTSSSTT